MGVYVPDGGIQEERLHKEGKFLPLGNLVSGMEEINIFFRQNKVYEMSHGIKGRILGAGEMA